MILNLAANHAEYWKTARRDGHTLGFEWFATFPSSRRLRFPWGRNKPVGMGWETKWSKIVDSTKEGQSIPNVLGYDIAGKLLWVENGGLVDLTEHNKRQHFDKDGNEL